MRDIITSTVVVASDRGRKEVRGRKGGRDRRGRESGSDRGREERREGGNKEESVPKHNSCLHNTVQHTPLFSFLSLYPLWGVGEGKPLCTNLLYACTYCTLYVDVLVHVHVHVHDTSAREMEMNGQTDGDRHMNM